MLLKVTPRDAAALAACLAAGIAYAGPAGNVSAWRTDYAAAVDEARARDRLVIVHFFRDDRPLCRQMERDTLGRPDVVRATGEAFVGVRIDVRSCPDLFDALIGGAGGLATCVVDGTEDVVSVLPGYAEPEAYLRFLETARKGRDRLKAARQAAERNPADAAAAEALGEVYMDLDSPRRAEAQFQKAIAGGGPDGSRAAAAFAHERLARLCVGRGRHRDALAHASEYRKRDPEGGLGRLDRILLTEAMAQYTAMRGAEAIRLLDEGLRKHPESAEADQMLYWLGVLRHETGDSPGALGVLDKVRREHAGSPCAAKAGELIAHILNPPAGHAH